MTGPAALVVEYLPLERLLRQSSSWWRGVLGVVGLGSPPPADRIPVQVPVAASMTPLIGGGAPVCEVWRVEAADAASANGLRERGCVRYRQCQQLLFGCVRINEAALARERGDSPAQALRAATELAYRDIFSVLDESGHARLVRVWHYLPDINTESEGDERYRHFNAARHAAFAQAGATEHGNIPAASALGSRSGSPVCIYFLAARHVPVMIENPRQVSAYRYPRQYGEHSPLFSRACILAAPAGAHLFVSGTASIVGHETVHRGDATAQTRETMKNITALLEEANRRDRLQRFAMDALKFKVYVRHRPDQPAIAGELARWLKPTTSVVYLEADVCRADLLVEIEASGHSTDA